MCGGLYREDGAGPALPGDVDRIARCLELYRERRDAQSLLLPSQHGALDPCLAAEDDGLRKQSPSRRLPLGVPSPRPLPPPVDRRSCSAVELHARVQRERFRGSLPCIPRTP